MKFKFFIYIIFFLNFSNTSHAEKFAFIDIDLLLKNSKFGSTLSKELEDVNNNNINLLKSMESQIRKNEEDLNKVKNVINEDEFNKKLNNLKTEIQSFNKEKDQLVIDFNELKQNKMKIFLNKIDPLIKVFMKENNISLLFEKKNIYIGLSTLDITNDILEKLNN